MNDKNPEFGEEATHGEIDKGEGILIDYKNRSIQMLEDR